MRHLRKQKDGFTLVELIVVLVILGILLGIAVPSFTGYITKQQENDAVTELREVVACAQSISNDAFSKNQPPASGYLEMTSAQKSEILKLSGTGGKIKKVVVDPDTYRITGLKYEAENGVMVRYDVDDDPKYAVSDESVFTELEKFIKSYQEVTQQMAANNEFINGAGNPTNHPNRENVVIPYLEHIGGTLPEVDSVFTDKLNINIPLYWQPYYLKDGSNGIVDSTMTLLFATPKDGSAADNIHNGWNAYLIYFNGQVYYSTNKGGTSGISSIYNIKTEEEFLEWIQDPKHPFEALV